MRFLWMVLLLPLFAGCAGDDTSGDPVVIDPVDRDDPIKAGKGGIAGLLVDERLRPIDLENEGEASGEFQAEGFVFIQELALQVLTDENGEFALTNLEPGSYTIKLDTPGHEFVPVTIDVLAGEYTGLTMSARRISGDASFLVSQEYSFFSYCGLNVLLPLSDVCYIIDQSGDSGRVFLDLDWTSYGDNLTAAQIEFKSNQQGNYYFLFGGNLSDIGSSHYFLTPFVNGDYGRWALYPNVTHEETGGTGSPYTNAAPHELTLYINGELDDEISDALFGLPLTGVGLQLAISGKLRFYLHLGTPLEDPETYCTLCPA